MTISLSLGSSKSTFFRLCSRAPLMTMRLFGSILILELRFAGFFSGVVLNFYISSCPCVFWQRPCVHWCRRRWDLLRVPAAEFRRAAARPAQIVAARGLLHLLGQAFNCLLALGAAHAVLAHPLVFLAHADFEPAADGLDDGFGRDAVLFIVGVLNGAAALGLHDGALHAGRDSSAYMSTTPLALRAARPIV